MKKQIKFIFDLDCCFTVYVPSTVNVNESTDNTEYINKVMRDMAAMFGGATSTAAIGCWIAETGEQVIEHITKVYSFAPQTRHRQTSKRLSAFVNGLKKEMNQEAISLEYNGQLKFI